MARLSIRLQGPFQVALDGQRVTAFVEWPLLVLDPLVEVTHRGVLLALANSG